jgi:thymidylate synthase (FAD)
MRLVKPLVIVEDDLGMQLPNGMTMAEHMLRKTEMFTRKCYKSEGRATADSYRKFITAVFATRRHTGIAEHRLVSVTFVTDRGVSHEFVRHRIAAYLQESTRYCDYSESKDPKGVCYILPPWMSPESPQWGGFIGDLADDDRRYARYRDAGWFPEQARYWLPQGVKTEYAASLNLGGWHNFFDKRVSTAAHPQMRQVAIPLFRYFRQHLPEFYGDLWPNLELRSDGRFVHPLKSGGEAVYPEAKLVINPYYDQVPLEEIDIRGDRG